MNNKALHPYAVFVACATFLLVIAGGLVTSTGSALAVPDWPLSYGQWFPPMEGGVLFEHGHRMIAAAVGFLTIILALWIWRRDCRPRVRKLVFWAVAAVCAQGLLGGITVLLKLPPVVAVAHAVLGQTFFTLIVCVAILAGDETERPFIRDDQLPRLRRLEYLTIGFIYFQLIAGAIVRHAGRGFHFHLLGAVLVAVHILLLARRVLSEVPAEAGLRSWAWALMGLLGCQLVLGYFSWKAGKVAVTTAHVGIGALMLAATVVLTIQTKRRLMTT